MMDNSLVATNVRQRPLRTLISVVGVALGVVLIVLVVGLSRGMLKEQGRRNSNVGAEIIFRRPGAVSFTSNFGLSLPIQYAQRLSTIEGIENVSPVGQYLKPSDQGFGAELIDGIEYESYAKVSNIRIVKGKSFSTGNEVIVDPTYVKNRKVKLGDSIELFGKKFTITGIYEPEIGSRIKMNLSLMQSILNAQDRATFVLVKCKTNFTEQNVAAEINQQLPGNQLLFVRDLQELYEKGSSALNTFLSVIIVISIVISTLVIMLAMYTTITERTREIGILKSLGAPKRFIIVTIEKEALLISLLGIVFGYVVAFAGRFLITYYTPLFIDIETKWMLVAGLCGIVSGFFGALYPALRAANQDPIKAISYE